MATATLPKSILPSDLDESFLRKDHLLSIYNAIKNWSQEEQRKFLVDNISDVTPMLPLIEYLFSTETVHTELLHDCFKLAFISINQNAVLEKNPKKRKGKHATASDKRKSVRLVTMRQKLSTAKRLLAEPVELSSPIPLKQKSPEPIRRKASDLLPKNLQGQFGCILSDSREKVPRKVCPARKFASVTYQGWRRPDLGG